MKSTAKKPKAYDNPTTQFLGTLVATMIAAIGALLGFMSVYSNLNEELREFIAPISFIALAMAAAILLVALISTVRFRRREVRTITPPPGRKSREVPMTPLQGRKSYARMTNTVPTI